VRGAASRPGATAHGAPPHAAGGGEWFDAHTRALLEKYDVPGPRYTSYPAVTEWDEARFDLAGWQATLQRTLSESGPATLASVYVHLPYCERLCTFCGCNRVVTRNHAVEAPYVDSVLREWQAQLEWLPQKPPIRELHLGGGTPTFFHPAEIERLVAGLLARATVCPDRQFSFEAHPLSTTPAHLERLRALGFERVSFGIQDLDPDVQAIINRVQPPGRIAEVTAAARAAGYASIGYDLLYGLPRQTPASVSRTMAAVVDLRPDRIAFYGYAHVPWLKGIGQRRYRDCDVPRGAAKRALHAAGRALLLEAGYREIGMDHFALPGDALAQAAASGRLHRNFMGYTPAHTRLTIGLGASAISDSWYGYAHNVKDVADYRARVDAGRSAVFRGHLLTLEDRIVRRHILDLMCRFETSWTAPDARHPGLDETLSRLQALADDGLVELDAGRLRVTARGRAFVRNVCMAFDARLARKGVAERRHSRTV
jgi:oxygen-independent coproporphyrinogen-3 oxidase